MKATQYRRLSGAVSNSAKRSSELCPGIVSSRSLLALSGPSMSAQRSRQPPYSGVGSGAGGRGRRRDSAAHTAFELGGGAIHPYWALILVVVCAKIWLPMWIGAGE